MFNLSGFVEAGPFGTEMGDPIEKYPGFGSLSKDCSYFGKNVPKPHKHFEYYSLTIPKKYGLVACSTLNMSKDTSTTQTLYNDIINKLK